MQWYYEQGGERRGPVDAGTLTALVEQEAIGPGTLVWNPDMADWQPYASVQAAPAEVPPPIPAEAQHTCIECGETRSLTDVLHYRSVWICEQCKPYFFQRLKQGTLYPLGLPYASFGRRAGAKMIDWVLLGAIQGAFQIASNLVQDAMETTPSWFSVALYVIGILLGLFIFVLYNGWMIGRFGATLGKMALGIRVVMPETTTIHYGRAIGRACAEILSGMLLYLGYLTPLVDSENRALHDYICDTRVVMED